MTTMFANQLDLVKQWVRTNNNTERWISLRKNDTPKQCPRKGDVCTFVFVFSVVPYQKHNRSRFSVHVSAPAVKKIYYKRTRVVIEPMTPWLLPMRHTTSPPRLHDGYDWLDSHNSSTYCVDLSITDFRLGRWVNFMILNNFATSPKSFVCCLVFVRWRAKHSKRNRTWANMNKRYRKFVFPSFECWCKYICLWNRRPGVNCYNDYGSSCYIGIV